MPASGPGRRRAVTGRVLGGWRWAVVAGALLLLALACGCAGPRERPNLVILLVDTLRPDRMSCYGYGRRTTPRVDSLAAHGLVFSRCYATSDYTPASTASLLTGQYPLAHGYVNANYSLEPAAHTLAEVLKEQGYHTGGFVANGLVGRKYGMDQGFDEFYESNRAAAPELADTLAHFIRRQADVPFFAYAHFMDVHDPYRLPPTAWGRFVDPAGFSHDLQDTLVHEQMVAEAWWRAIGVAHRGEPMPVEVSRYFREYGELYDAGIAYWDEQLAGVLAALTESGQASHTVVVVVADHGEQLLEHGFFGHGNSGYEVGIRVPLVIHDPERARQGTWRSDEPVSLVDVVPTLLTRMQLLLPATVQGVNHWPREGVAESATASTSGVYTEGTFFANRPFSTLIQTYQDGRWKLVLDRLRDVKELYDLEQDPGEERDLLASQPEIAARLAQGLRERYHQGLALFVRQRRMGGQLPDERLRELQALGYLAGRSGPARPGPEFHAMQPIPLTAFGPYGDEEDLAGFGGTIDFTRGRATWGQVVRGYSDTLGRIDPAGCWFDSRATFLLPNPDHGARVVFEVDAAPDPQGGRVTWVAFELNGALHGRTELTKPGFHQLSVTLPAALRDEPYLQAGLVTDHRFVLERGATVRGYQFAALKIRQVRVERE